MSKAYSSNLSQAQFELIEPLIPPAKPGGRHREVEMWAVLNAILYVVVQGCKWRDLPGDFPVWQTVYTYFRNWRQDGTWVAIHDRLRGWLRADNGRLLSPSEAIVDSQSVATATMVHESVGFDKAKHTKGRKRHLTVDTLGLILRVLVTAASVPECVAGQASASEGAPNGRCCFPPLLDLGRWRLQWQSFLDLGDGCLSRSLSKSCCDSLQTKGFVLLKKRWVVERT